MSERDVALLGIFAARDGLISAAVEPCSEEPDKEEIISPEVYSQLKDHVQEIVRQQFRLEETVRSRDPVVRSKFKAIALNCMRYLDIRVSAPDVPALVQRLFDDIMGYGPLERHFWDPEVTEIIVNNTKITIEKNGIEFDAKEQFESVEQARDVVQRMIAPTGKRLDYAEPEVNARLFDGSRLIAQIAPIAVDGILVAIRRFRQDLTVAELLKNGAFSRALLDFLRAAVVSRQNIVVSGGTGSGKTTLLNVLGSFIPESDRIITIEDPAELRLQHPKVRRLEARPPNIEGKGEIPIRRLVKSALRMAPKRIIVGECRGAEAFDMLQAMNTGHLGSLTTLHANSAADSITRLVGMVLQTGMDLNESAILNMIASAVDLIVHVEMDRTGRRRVDHVVEVAGIRRNEAGAICGVELNPLWAFSREKNDWVWVGRKFLRKEKLVREGGWRCSL
ncbi:MAG: pilus assembly protein CpaF [Thermacetogenium sp.]|nr:pilus assembly protein CpaF [Thermacetogenium sp.]